MAGDLTTAMIDLDAGPVEYRLDRRGSACVLWCHGGHMRAGLALGEELVAELGYTVVVPSRPGYGRTPLRTGRSPAAFADAAAELCQRLEIGRLAAVVGTSGICGRRFALPTASILALPARYGGTDALRLIEVSMMCPASTSFSAGVAPR